MEKRSEKPMGYINDWKITAESIKLPEMSVHVATKLLISMSKWTLYCPNQPCLLFLFMLPLKKNEIKPM